MDLGGSETAQQPDSNIRSAWHWSTAWKCSHCPDAVSQCHPLRACPSRKGLSSSFGTLFPINEESLLHELLVGFRSWVGQSDKKERRLVAYKKRMEQRYDRSFRKTLLGFMPKVFSLLSSCQVASCSSNSWLPQARSLLTWNLCDSYKRKTKIITWERETDISGFGWEWNYATARQATYEVHGIGRQHESAVTARMPLANAILFVLVLREKDSLHLSGPYSR